MVVSVARDLARGEKKSCSARGKRLFAACAATQTSSLQKGRTRLHGHKKKAIHVFSKVHTAFQVKERNQTWIKK